MYKGLSIGVVVLAYKVEGHIEGVIKTLPDFVDRIYVIDDCSPDRTAGMVRGLNTERVKLIQHQTNMGPGAGLTTGYRAALDDGMAVVVKVDGDGQMDPGQIENLIIPIVNGEVDYTKGDRLSFETNRISMPRFRLGGNLILTWLTRIASGYWRLNDSQNGFTAISQKALERIDLNFYPYYGYLNDILVQLNVGGFKIRGVSMPSRYGTEKSSISLRRYVPKVAFVLLRKYFWRMKQKANLFSESSHQAQGYNSQRLTCARRNDDKCLPNKHHFEACSSSVVECRDIPAESSQNDGEFVSADSSQKQ